MLKNKFLLFLWFFLFLVIGSYFGTKYYFTSQENSYWKNWNNTLKEKNLIVVALHEIGHVVMNLEIPPYQEHQIDDAFIKFEHKLEKVTIVPDEKADYSGLTTSRFFCSGDIRICSQKKTLLSFLPFFSVEIAKQYLYNYLAGNKVVEIFLKGKNTTNLNYYNDFLNSPKVKKNSDLYKAKAAAKIISLKTKQPIKTVLEESYQAVEKILLTKQNLILLLSRVLLNKKTLIKTEIDIVIANLNSSEKLSDHNLYSQTWDWEIFAPYKEDKLEFWKIFSLAVFFSLGLLVLVFFVTTLLKKPQK